MNDPITAIEKGDTASNREFYGEWWAGTYLVSPDRFKTWLAMSELAARSARRLEAGPGLRPRLPIAGTHFLDLSEPAVNQLRERGGLAIRGEVSAIPFPNAAFDLEIGRAHV